MPVPPVETLRLAPHPVKNDPPIGQHPIHIEQQYPNRLDARPQERFYRLAQIAFSPAAPVIQGSSR
jgi:hypothetical protein